MYELSLSFLWQESSLLNKVLYATVTSMDQLNIHDIVILSHKCSPVMFLMVLFTY